MFLVFSILGIIDANNSSGHTRIFQNIGLMLISLAGFLGGYYAERKLSSTKDLLSEREETHIAIWWLETVGFWLSFGATIFMVIRYFGGI